MSRAADAIQLAGWRRCLRIYRLPRCRGNSGTVQLRAGLPAFASAFTREGHSGDATLHPVVSAQRCVVARSHPSKNRYSALSVDVGYALVLLRRGGYGQPKQPGG